MTTASFLVQLIILANLALFGAVAMRPIDRALNAAIVRVLLQVLFEFGVEPKDAMDQFGYDKSQWSRMCSGERPAPSITRISSALTWQQLAAFIPEWSKVIARHKLLGMEEGASALRRSA